MTSSRILFVGDPHGKLRYVAEYVLHYKPRALVLLGDIEPGDPLDDELGELLKANVQVAWIHGNHDNADDQMWRDLTDAERNPITSFGALHGRVVEVGDIRIAGLGGIFREPIWHPGAGDGAIKYRSFEEFAKRDRRLRPRFAEDRALVHRATIFPDVYERMWDLRADILASHEAPSCHRHGFAEIDDLARAMGARTIIHGHHHEDYVAVHKNGDLTVYGVGRAAAVDEHGQLVEPSRERPRREPQVHDSGDWLRLR